MKKQILYLAGIAAIFASCSREAIEAPEKTKGPRHIRIQASVEDTRTSLSIDGTTGTYSWQPQETIAVMEENGSEPCVFEVSNPVEGYFDGEATNALIGAVSPYLALGSYTGTQYMLSLSGEYEYMNGATNAVMVAGTPTVVNGQEGDMQKFTFKHAAGLVMVTYENLPLGTKGVRFTTNKPIVGNWTFNSFDNVVLNGLTEGSSTAYVLFSEPIGNDQLNQTFSFYIPVPVNDYTGLEIALVDNGKNDIDGTKKKMSSKSFSVAQGGVIKFPTVTLSPAPFFHESFNNFDGTGANDGSWSGGIAAKEWKDEFCDNPGWTVENANMAKAAAKFGAGSKKGSATTPALGITSETATLTLKAAAWNGSSETTTINVSVVGNGAASVESITLVKGQWSTYSIVLGAGIDNNTKVKFEAANVSNNRFFIDDVLVEVGGTMPAIENLTVTPSTENPETVSYEGGVMTYSVTAENIDSWDAESSDEAFVVAKNNDDFVVTVAENESSTPRSATITVTGGTKTVTVTINQEGAPEVIESLTIAQFLAKQPGDTYYQLTGKLTNLENATYGNFTLVDETGSVYVYGLTKTQVASNDKSFGSIGVGEGDFVTLVGKRAVYSGTAQVGGPAYYVSHIPAPVISVTPTTKTVLATATSVEIAITSNADWTITGEGITANPSSGSGNGSATLTFAARTVAGDAQLVATVKADIDPTVYETVTIIQHGTDYVAPTGWVETDLAEIGAGDVFVIVGNNGSNYAMSNNNGTTSAPSAVAVTVNDGKITSTVSNNIKWNLTAGSGSYVFYPNGVTTTWLYTTTSNNGLRVGTNDHKNIVLDSNGYMTINDGSNTRYIGVYTSSDWRSYTSVNANIKDQTFKFYKLFGEDPGGDTNPTYKISFTQPTVGGTFTVKVNNTEISSGDEFESGTTVSIKATPNTNYTFTSWTITGASLSDATLDETSFVVGSSDVTIGASFAALSVATLPFTYSATGVANNSAITDVDLPTGMSYDSSVPVSNYKCYAGYLGMRKDGCAYIVHFDVAAAGISFTGKGQTATDNTMTVAGSVDGVTYTTIQTFSIDESSDTQKTVSEAISSTYRYVKFTFNKNTGNYALKSISITN